MPELFWEKWLVLTAIIDISETTYNILIIYISYKYTMFFD